MPRQATEFCAAIEPFGLRDIARIEPDEYKARLKALLTALQGVLISNTTTTAILAVHTCFLVDRSLKTLVDILSKLRGDLLRSTSHLPIRGIIMEGSITQAPFASWRQDQSGNNAYWRDPEKTAGFTLNETAGDLISRLERLKAVAIQVDASLTTSKSQEFVPNFYVTDSKSKRIVEFWEVPLQKADLRSETLETITKEFRSAYHRSRKQSRFFLPLLYNWCGVAPTKEIVIDGTRTEKTIGRLFLGEFFLAFREVPGMDLLHCRFLERIYQLRDTLGADDTDKYITHFAKLKWLQEMIRSDGDTLSIPERTLSEGAKRWYIGQLAKSSGT